MFETYTNRPFFDTATGRCQRFSASAVAFVFLGEGAFLINNLSRRNPKVGNLYFQPF